MHPNSFRIGDMTIYRIVESEVPFMAAMDLLPGLTPEILDEHRSWLEPAALEPATGKLIFCFQSYLVQTTHHVVLIDSCVGNDKERPTRPSWHLKTDQTYMSALASAGIAVEDIDYVICTHLHPDHVGWNRRMSKELDDVTRSLAEALTALGRATKAVETEHAITDLADCLIMALGSIERRLDLLERSRVARLH
jgi:glyoxylase-like metal-dependent hydrolase (beta-lactamase superfamily II)